LIGLFDRILFLHWEEPIQEFSRYSPRIQHPARPLRYAFCIL